MSSLCSPHRFNKIREVGFKALGREFRLVLSPKKGLLHKNFKAVEVDDVDDKTTERPVVIDHEAFYEGRVFGEMRSRAAVHLEDGVMTAKIETPEDVYMIEPSWRHLPTNDTQQMIAYRESDVKFSWTQPGGGEEEGGKYFVPERVCDYIKENGTVGEDDEMEDLYDEHGHRIEHEHVDEFGHRIKRQATGSLL